MVASATLIVDVPHAPVCVAKLPIKAIKAAPAAAIKIAVVCAATAFAYDFMIVFF